jgi:type II secretory pathway pseudopilin PulG
MNTSPWLDLFKYSWPIILAYTAAAIVAIVMMPRHRKPAILSLIGAALLLTALAIPTAYRNRQFNAYGSYSVERARAIYLAADTVRAGGITLLIIAAYVGRKGNPATQYGYGFQLGGFAPPPYGSPAYGTPPYGVPQYAPGVANPQAPGYAPTPPMARGGNEPRA